MTEKINRKYHVISDVVPESAWTKAVAGRRSEELTAIYVTRQRGRFSNEEATHHDHWEILTVRSGTGSLVTPAGMIPLAPHTVCLIPSGTAHRETSRDILDVIWIGVRGHRVAALDDHSVRVVSNREISDRLEQTWMFVQITPGGIGPELDAVAAWIVHRLLRSERAGYTPGTDRIERAITFLHERMAEPVALGDVAKRLGCSASYLTREFRRRTGLTPIRYLTGIRIRRAAHLLETTDLPAREIATLTGYLDPFYFSRAFRRIMGRSPLQWRWDRQTR